MKASDAKKFIGQYVRYKKDHDCRWRYGMVESTVGRNIIMQTDALWAPDIKTMELVPKEELQA